MKKTMYLALAVLFLWGVWFSTPLTALAAEGEPAITAVELTATKSLIENVDCYMEYDNIQNYEPFNYYELNATEPNIKLTFSDGTTKEFKFFDEDCGYWDYFSDPIWCEQGAGDKELKPGTHTKTVCMTCSYNANLGLDEYIETTYTFTIVENPVESISVVANNSLTENVSGDFINVTDDEGNIVGSDFAYDVSLADIKVTVNYKNGTSSTYDYCGEEATDIMQQTGYDLFFDNHSTLVVGSNTVTAEYMGLKTPFEVVVVENPYKSISLEATDDLIYNFSGENYDAYFEYSIALTQPIVTVTYANNDVRTYTYSECGSQFGDYPEFKIEQSPSNQFVKGENTQTVFFLGHECEFTFNIVETPVKSIIVNTPPMQVSDYGYSLDSDETKVTINYKDEGKPSETYILAQLEEEYYDEFSLSLNQGENELTVGKHQGTVSFLGYETTFEFEIVANPIKSVTAVGTVKLIENEDGSQNGEYDGEPYFHYYIYDTNPKVTVTFSDGTAKTYNYYDLEELGYDYDLDVFQNAENPLKVGKNTGYIELNGVRGEFTFEIIENPIKSISLKATKDLVEKQNGYWCQASEEEEMFWYYVDETLPEVTVNYKDGTSKTYSYGQFVNDSGYWIYFDVEQGVSPLKVGENTIKVYIGNFECEYTFNIVKPEVAITGITVVPEGTLLEGNNCDVVYDEEGNEGFTYYPDAVNYTLIVKYEDGTQKTYKNVSCMQAVDGSYFTVNFGGWEYEDRFVVGKNKAYAEYKGARTTFDIEVVKNDIKAVEISGNNEFVLTTTTSDGTKTKYTAKDFYIGGMSGENIYDGTLYTDKGQLMVSVALNINEDETAYKDIVLYFTLPDGTILESNKLSSNRWFDILNHAYNLDEASVWLYDGYSEQYFGTSFHELEGSVIKGSAVDKALTICTALDYIGNYENTGEDDKGRFAILTLAETEKLAKNYFAEGKLDIESSPLYNAPAKEIKVYFLLGCDGIGISRELKYENGKFILTSMCENHYTYETIPVKMILLDTGYVDSIYVSEHSYTSEIIKQPTATEKGIKEYTCSCGDSYLADIDKLVASVPVNKDNSFSATVTVTETENIVSKIEVTKEEQVLIDSGLNLEIVLKVEELENKVDTEEKEQIVEFLRDKVAGEQKLGAFIDIQLVKQIGDYEKNIEKTKGEFQITFLLPDDLINTDKSLERVYKIARYHDGDENNVTLLDATYDEKTKYLTFSTDRFSTYAIVYSDVEASNDGVSGGVSEGVPAIPDSDNSKDDVPKAGVISTSAIWLGAMAVSGLGALALSKKKRED